MIITSVKKIANGLSCLLPDKLYLKIKFRYMTGETLNFKSPQTFNQKLQWLKLYNRNPLYTKLVDKYEVRKYIAETIGEEYLIPLIDVYNDVDEIDWSELPNQFVLKCTHGSGANIICTDKGKLDIQEAEKQLKKWMKRNWYWHGREWPYKNVKPRIICEKFLTENPSTSALTDYKFFCFHGEVKFCQVIRNRGANETIDFYDIHWNHMPFTGLRNLPNSKVNYPKPENYFEMINLAKKLSSGLPFIRVDFYNLGGKILFGELTFFPMSGFGSFYPIEWNKIIGDLINIS
jgi:hypothetical protein